MKTISKAILIVTFLFGQLVSLAQQKERPYVLLISFDGFRYDYVNKYNPPNFKKFISKGAQAEALIPSFPSKTFPNHYTIVTGLNPGNHGLVDNRFYDPARNASYSMSDKKNAVLDGYYYGGVPLWELAKKNGLKSASYFWVGSEISDEERRPDYFYFFNDSVPSMDRVNQVMRWLALPAEDRPHLITLYFSFPDHEGHDYGPNAEETKHAVLRADTLLGKIMTGISNTKLPVNIVVVSDHGMYEVSNDEQHQIFIDEWIDRKNKSVRVANGGTQTHVYLADPLKKDSVYNALIKHNDKIKVTFKDDFNDKWQYKSSRVGDILIEALPGYYIREGSRERYLKSPKLSASMGVHGYDPAVVNEMLGIFYASGPNIKKGATIKPFQNIHIYPLIAQILQLPLPQIDGKSEVLNGILKLK